MPNRFTAVPTGPVPPAGRVMSPVVAVADLFMGLMLSRPGGLSLRTAWVTPGTLLLTGLFTPVAAALAVLLLTRGGWWIVCAVLLLVAGSAARPSPPSGVAQRRHAADRCPATCRRSARAARARRPPYSPPGWTQSRSAQMGSPHR